MTDEPLQHKSDVILAPESAAKQPTLGVDLAPAGATEGASNAPPPSTGSQPILIQQPRAVTPVPMTLRSWPVVDSLFEFLLLTAALLGVPIVVFQQLGPTSSAITAAALVWVTWRHFVPTLFELSALGVTESCLGRTRRIPWISIDRYVVGRRGVFLSSAGAPLERFRGLYLPWGKQREQLLTTLRYYLPRAEESA
jgi:hypothetical protein